MIAPFVPRHLQQEHTRCVEDVEFALKLGACSMTQFREAGYAKKGWAG